MMSLNIQRKEGWQVMMIERRQAIFSSAPGKVSIVGSLKATRAVFDKLKFVD